MAALVYLFPFLSGVWAPGETPRRCLPLPLEEGEDEAVGMWAVEFPSPRPSPGREERKGSQIIRRLQIAD